MHIKTSELEIFPLPDFSSTDKKILAIIEEKFEEYKKDVEKNIIDRGTYKEYKLRKSKKLIDGLEKLICPLYGLSDEQTNFIVNYELEFRIEDED